MRAVIWNGVQFWNGAALPRGCVFALSCVLALMLSAPSVNSAVSVPDGAMGRREVAEQAAVEVKLLIHPDDRVESRIRFGVLVDLPTGWHTYWRNPGDTGLPIQLDWQVSGGEVGPIAWPAPSRYEESDGLLITHGYSDQVLLASTAVFSESRENRPIGERRIGVEVDLLVCEATCIPLHFSLHRTIHSGALPSGSKPSASEPARNELEYAQTRAIFARYARRVPRDPATAGVDLQVFYSQTAIRPGDSFEAAIALLPRGSKGLLGAAPPVAASFFPHGLRATTLSVTGLRAHPRGESGKIVVLGGSASAQGAEPDFRLTGVLVLESATGEKRALEIDLPIAIAPVGAVVAELDWATAAGLVSAMGPSGARVTDANPGDVAHAEELGLALALLLAFAGGLVLNLMPCVLPVLAIKVCGLVETAHQHRGVQIRYALAYALGVGLSFVALAAGVIVLRAAGTSVGWGFQLQEPLFVAVVSAVLVVFAMNLFGVFEISVNTGGLASVGADATGSRRSFCEGLLVVVLATPCSAPFLGTAVGFAFASSAPVVLSVFLAIGAGLAAPFLLVSCMPALSRFVPRGGAWMLKLRAVLGFCLLASAVWLIWVFGRTTGPDGTAALVALLLATAFAAQSYGWAQNAGRTGFAHVIGFASLAFLVVGFDSISTEPDAAHTDVDAVEAAGTWRPFHADAVAAVLREGKPALVSFTADWCLTCKVNERVVLGNERVRETIARLGVATFEADWTRRDEGIRAELARFGRAGVPLLVVYSPDEPDRPVQLPDLITVGSLLEVLHAAAPSLPSRATALSVSGSAPAIDSVTGVTRL